MRPFPLHPGLGPDGVRLVDLFRGRFDVAAAHRAMAVRMDAEGLEYHPPDRAWDTRLAQELACWAEAHDVSLHGPLFRAVFVEQKNIGRTDVLLDLAEGAGLPRGEAERALTERTHRDAVDAHWGYGRRRGVTAVPTYAVDRFSVAGAQPYDTLVAMVLRAGVAPNPVGTR